jgi:hypothetical protein
VIFLNGLFWSWGIGHGVTSLGVLLSTKELLFTDRGLLLLLDQVAESAAAGLEDISDAVSLEVVLLSEFLALHCLWNPVETDTSGGNEEKALVWIRQFKAMNDMLTEVLMGSYPSRLPFFL